MDNFFSDIIDTVRNSETATNLVTWVGENGVAASVIAGLGGIVFAGAMGLAFPIVAPVAVAGAGTAALAGGGGAALTAAAAAPAAGILSRIGITGLFTAAAPAAINTGGNIWLLNTTIGLITTAALTIGGVVAAVYAGSMLMKSFGKSDESDKARELKDRIAEQEAKLEQMQVQQAQAYTAMPPIAPPVMPVAYPAAGAPVMLPGQPQPVMMPQALPIAPSATTVPSTPMIYGAPSPQPMATAVAQPLVAANTADAPVAMNPILPTATQGQTNWVQRIGPRSTVANANFAVAEEARRAQAALSGTEKIAGAG